MKTQTKTLNQVMLFILFTLLGSFAANAAERIDGNGKLITKSKTVEQFYQIDVQTFCNVIVNAGAMPMVSFQVDENLHDYYTTEVIDGVLTIKAKEWPEPTKILVTIQVPFITSLSNSGWGSVQINNLKTENFHLRAETGKIKLSGKVKQLDILAGGGKINAQAMETSSINLVQDGHGITQLGKTDALTISGALAKVYIKGTPTIERSEAKKSLKVYNEKGLLVSTTTEPKIPIEYINVTIKNNSLGWNSFVIRGPKSRKFSYGFSLFPYSTKSERIPVGTAFYKEYISGREEKLVEIKASDANTTINLFE